MFPLPGVQPRYMSVLRGDWWSITINPKCFLILLLCSWCFNLCVALPHSCMFTLGAMFALPYEKIFEDFTPLFGHKHITLLIYLAMKSKLCLSNRCYLSSNTIFSSTNYSLPCRLRSTGYVPFSQCCQVSTFSNDLLLHFGIYYYMFIVLLLSRRIWHTLGVPMLILFMVGKLAHRQASLYGLLNFGVGDRS